MILPLASRTLKTRPLSANAQSLALIPAAARDRPALTSGFLDVRYADLNMLLKAIRRGDLELSRWQVAVQLPPTPGEARGRVVRWWDAAADATDRQAALDLLRPAWVREQWQLETKINFYQQPAVVREAILKLKDCCENGIHFEQQMRRIGRQTVGGATPHLVETLTRYFPAMGEALRAALPAADPECPEARKTDRSPVTLQHESEVSHVGI